MQIGKKKHRQSKWQNLDRTQMLALSGKEWKITRLKNNIINILETLIEKVDNTQEQRGNVHTEV